MSAEKRPETALILPDGTRVDPGLVEELQQIFDVIYRYNDPEIRLVPFPEGYDYYRSSRTRRPVSPGLLWRLHPRLRPPRKPGGWQAWFREREGRE